MISASSTSAQPATSRQQVAIKYVATPTAKRFHQDKSSFFKGIRGPIGCLPAGTEFLTPRGWKNIEDYQEGDLVAGWCPVTDALKFTQPLDYINADATGTEFIGFSNKGLHMTLTANHTVALFDWKGEFQTRTAEQLAQRLSIKTLPTSFMPTTPGIDLSDDWIRLAVVLNADGTIPPVGKQLTFTFRKDRKKLRFTSLLARLGIEASLYCNSNRPTEIRYTIPRPEHPLFSQKRYDGQWWDASREQLELIIDEMGHWDGLANREETRFTTAHLIDADFMQYAAHATGGRATIGFNQPKNPKHSRMYIVHIASRGSVRSRVLIRNDSVTVTRGLSFTRQYCFTMPTGFFLVRQEGSIFLTGNSSKSVTCIMELFNLALSQQPNASGLRKTRWAVVRQTYPELRSTTIRSFQDWIPETICPIKMSDSPISALLTLPLPDKTLVMAEFLFIALEASKDIGKLLSLELTGAFLNEAKECGREIIDGLTSRVGRYPSKRDGGGPTWSGVLADTNAPNSAHWWAELERNPPPKWSFYVQPPALLETSPGVYEPNPEAENVENQPKGYQYWLDAITGKEPSWIRAYVLNQFALVSAGKPVFGDHFNERFHVSTNKLWPVKDVPVYVGFDFGLTPAAVFGQIHPATGQLRILDSVSAKRMGFSNFLLEVVLPLVAEKYSRNQRVYVGDPSGVKASDTDEKSCYDVARLVGIHISPAPTNNIEPRLEAVRQWLSRTVGKGQPAMLISPHCEMLIEGFASGYQYDKVQATGEARYRDKPSKNRFSHEHDSLQYLCSRINMALKTEATRQQIASSSTKAAFVPIDSLTGY